jgi:hypothetical protein
MPRTSPYQIVLSAQERDELEARARRYTSSYAQVVRAKIVLMAAEGLRNDQIASRLDTPRQVSRSALLGGLSAPQAGGGVDGGGDVEQVEDLVLEVGEFGREGA